MPAGRLSFKTVAVLSLLAIAILSTAAQHCKSHNDCSPRQMCYQQGTCGCIALFGLEGPPDCRQATPASYCLLTLSYILAIAHLGAVYLSVLALHGLAKEVPVVWQALTSYKFYFLILSIIFNIFPVINRILLSIFIFTDIELHKSCLNSKSLWIGAAVVGFDAVILSFLIIGRIWLNLAAGLGDPWLKYISHSWMTTLILLLPALVILLMGLVAFTVSFSVRVASLMLLANSVLIGCSFCVAATTVVRAVCEKLRLDELQQRRSDSSESSSTSNRRWQRWSNYRLQLRILSTIAENSHEGSSHFDNASRCSLITSTTDYNFGLTREDAKNELPRVPEVEISSSTPSEEPTRPASPRGGSTGGVGESKEMSWEEEAYLRLSQETESGIRMMVVAYTIIRLAVRVMGCAFIAATTMLIYANIQFKTNPWSGVAAQAIVQIGITAFMVGNLHCIYLVSKPAREVMDRFDWRRRAKLARNRRRSGGRGGGGGGNGGGAVNIPPREVRAGSLRQQQRQHHAARRPSS